MEDYIICPRIDKVKQSNILKDLGLVVYQCSKCDKDVMGDPTIPFEIIKICPSCLADFTSKQ